ncbi:hypothetical protein B9G98_02025 [Wickerhamiella sorbophila]|uniref:Glycosyl hydrolase n=1 Tax=Wickerhamiella sorbophila TaxID=45607 RepID=A0A2T0FHE5_9ASCO|nr:hypothetical protein B9G98_02025 [Wickerhamiella sorbophila]PRT54405.1 hypothetical protein B9G98_02025 [Wickerhamiella sorbophila]
MKLKVVDGQIQNEDNQTVFLRGINVDGSTKMPATPLLTTFHSGPAFFQGDSVSFVGRPFPLDEAPGHFQHIKDWGFNTIRYIFTWEGIEHEGPGKYDDDFVEYTIKMLELAVSAGFYVFLDPHQDVWGRFSGGSGAPMWTYYAAGLDPHNFNQTRAAIVQNLLDDPQQLPKMIWPTNYYRYACQVMFTLFFAGKDYAPKCILDGVNIQDYLQSHMLDACMHLYKRVEKAGLFDRGVFGIESMNEPNIGLVGTPNIGELPSYQNLRLGSTPTAFQSMLLASGNSVKVSYYDFGSLGPKFRKKRLVDPEKTTAFITDTQKDEHYGWQRGPEWEIGRCIWAQHGVWDDKTLELLKPHYFKPTEAHLDHEQFFVEKFFVPYWGKLYNRFRKELPDDLFLLCQPPTLAIPPKLKETPYIDDRVVYAPHFYDGLTLMLKRWSSLWNVDALGYLRGYYRLPVFALKIGESSIRHCLTKQIGIIDREGRENFGEKVPILMSETGVPMDMNDKEPFLNHNYTPQIKALDAMAAGLEHHQMHFTYWCYSSTNCHERGDLWNYEDFSFRSLSGGTRAMQAFVRPGPITVEGTIRKSRFDLYRNQYSFVIDGKECDEGHYTTVYVPDVHFSEQCKICISGGRYEINSEILKWWHPAGKQKLKISEAPSKCVIC